VEVSGGLTEGATAAGCANRVEGGVGSSFGWNVTDSLNEFCKILQIQSEAIKTHFFMRSETQGILRPF
jgi:hypothetical protein